MASAAIGCECMGKSYYLLVLSSKKDYIWMDCSQIASITLYRMREETQHIPQRGSVLV